MRTDRELLKDAVDAIEAIMCSEWAEPWGLIEEIRARLAEKEDEPVAWLIPGSITQNKQLAECQDNTPLYRHPPRQPVWLTDEEVKQVIRQTIPDVTVSESVTFRAIARAIKAAVMVKADD